MNQNDQDQPVTANFDEGLLEEIAVETVIYDGTEPTVAVDVAVAEPDTELDFELQPTVEETEKVFPQFQPIYPAGAVVVDPDAVVIERTEKNAKDYDAAFNMPAVPILGTSIKYIENRREVWQDSFPNIDEESDEFVNWDAAIASSIFVTSVTNDALNGAAFSPTARLDYGVEYGGRRHGARRLAAAKPSGSGTLAGKEAVAYLSAVTKTGGANTQPLWNSGYNVVLSRPNLDAQVDLDTLIATDRAILGRMTRGEIFTNDTYVTIRNFVRFAFDHLVQVGFEGGHDYDEFISNTAITDIQVLAGAFAAIIHPRGFPFVQPCTANAGKCNHVSRRLININKIIRVDNDKLTSEHLNIITRSTKVSKADLAKYREAFKYKNNYVNVTPEVRMFFKVPTIADLLQSGHRWVTEIEHSAETMFSKDLSIDERAKHLDKARIATLLRNRAPWIDHLVISIDDGETVNETRIEDQIAIEQQLNIWSENDEYMKVIIDGLDAFMGEAVVGFAGIPNFQCPKCQSWLQTDNGEPRVLHPVDAVNVFFLMQDYYLRAKVSPQTP